MTDPDAAADRFVEVIEREHKEARAIIDAATSPQDALNPALKVLRAAEATAEAAREFRDHIMGRVWEADEMSAAELAGRTNLTRQRVGQITGPRKGQP